MLPDWPDSLYEYLDFNIDHYLNPYIPRNYLYTLPKPISHFFGHRSHPIKEPPSIIQWIVTPIATVAGLCFVGGVYNYAPGVKEWHPPSIVASFGASAVLYYNAVPSPLGQPRNALLGHTLSAILGVAIAKAFMLVPTFFVEYDWVVAALACAAASLVMSMTNTVHPPGGATAILACTEHEIIALGWMYPPLVLLASVLMLTVACIFNNTFRRYPTFWWTPDEVGYRLPFSRRKHNDAQSAGEKADSASPDVESGDLDLDGREQGSWKNIESRSDSDRTLAHEFYNEIQFVEDLGDVHITPYMIRLPRKLDLSDDEVESLQHLMFKLRSHMEC